MEYLIRVTRTTEFEILVEADEPWLAIDIAKMEATGNSIILSEDIKVTGAPTIEIEDRLPQYTDAPA